MDPSASLTAPKAIRKMIREGDYSGPTIGFVPGFTQCNIVILPKVYAYDFLQFCQKNNDCCPLLAINDEPGDVGLSSLSDDIDIRKDVSKYQILRQGQFTEETTDIAQYWQDDFVTFALITDLSFEYALNCAGMKTKGLDPLKSLPLYVTDIPCNSVGKIKTNKVVSLRGMNERQIIKAIQVGTSNQTPHGIPIHFGSPDLIGIRNIRKPHFGEQLQLSPRQLPVFWTSSMTAQLAITALAPEICILNSPDHLLVTDHQDINLAIK